MLRVPYCNAGIGERTVLVVTEMLVSLATMDNRLSITSRSSGMQPGEDYLREAIELSRAAVSDGNPPFGSLLVVNDTIVRRSKNTTATEDDITAHPELKLARWAARHLSADKRAACTMYTSTEPCEMCSKAIHYAGLGRVVFSVSGETLATTRNESTSGIPCAEVVNRSGGDTTVEGPILEATGAAVHEEFYG